MAIDAVKLTQELVRIPSPTGSESQVAQFVKKIIEPFFDSVEIDALGNVLAIKFFDEQHPTILFNSHLDTVDPGEMKEPFSGKIVDGRPFGIAGEVVYGRGAADMKGALAGYIAAISRLKEISHPPNIVFHAVVEEEPARGRGTRYAMEHMDRKPDVAISGEATNLNICLGFRGYVQFQLETFGKTAHGSSPHQGINAIFLMRDFLNGLDGYIKTQESRVHPFLGKATCAVTKIECSPGRLSIVPDRCTLTFDSRYFPGESPQDREKELLALLKKLGQKDPDFKYELKIISTGMRPTFVPPEDKHVQLMKEAIIKVMGKEPQIKSWPYTHDGSYIVNDFGIPTVGFGPGQEKVLHTPQECVPVEQLQVAQQVYFTFLAMLPNIYPKGKGGIGNESEHEVS